MRVFAAFSVHLFTASGILWAFLAIDALMANDFYGTLIWLGLAYFVDMVDGTLARQARVKEVLPDFDGALLDNIIDYITYALIPALFLYRAELLPDGWGLPVAGLICMASTYQFCQADAKTEDNYFTGFPSYWNVAVLYFFLLGMNPWWNLALSLLLLALVFIPIQYIYPSRTSEFRQTNLVTTALWFLVMLVILALYPAVNRALLYASLLYVFYYMGISLYLTVRRRRVNSPAGPGV